MARYQSKHELQEIEMSKHTRAVVSALQEEVNKLATSWGDSIPDDYSKQIYALVGRSAALQQVPEANYMRSNVQIKAKEALAQPFLTIRHKQQHEIQKKQRAEFVESAKGRPVAEELLLRNRHEPGEIVIIQKQNQDEVIFTCLSCEWIDAPRDMGQDDDGYYTKLLEPTAAEMQTEDYQRAKKKVESGISYRETLRKQGQWLRENNEW